MSVVETVVGSGKYTYEVHEDWAQIPAGWEMPAAAVTVDAQDRVFVRDLLHENENLHIESLIHLLIDSFVPIHIESMKQ